MNHTHLMKSWKTKKGLSDSLYKSISGVGAMQLNRETMVISVQFWRRMVIDAGRPWTSHAEIGPDNVWTFHPSKTQGAHRRIEKLLGGQFSAVVFSKSSEVYSTRINLRDSGYGQWREFPFVDGTRIHADTKEILNPVADLKREVVKDVSARLRPDLDKLKRLTSVLLRMEGLDTRPWYQRGEDVTRPNKSFDGVDVSLSEESLPALAQYLYDLGRIYCTGPSVTYVHDTTGRYDPSKRRLANGDIVPTEQVRRMEKEYAIRLGLKHLRLHLLRQADGIRVVEKEAA